jgi:hypothetical protein
MPGRFRPAEDWQGDLMRKSAIAEGEKDGFNEIFMDKRAAELRDNGGSDRGCHKAPYRFVAEDLLSFPK